MAAALVSIVGCSSACWDVRPSPRQVARSGSTDATFTRADDTTRTASTREVSWSPQKAETVGTS